MATIEGALYTFLTTNSGIAAFVGTDIYPFSAPDLIDTDFIRYQVVSPSNIPQAFGDVTTAQPTIQIDIFSKDSSHALDIGNLVVTALHGFDGSLATGINVTVSTARGPRVTRDSSDEQWFHGIVEWEVEYTR
jgi:hypothetical protein